MADSYSWTSSGSGNWSTTANWFDLGTGSGATNAPGAADTATINGPGDGPITVTGPGAAASLTVNETVTLAGSFAIAALAIADLPANPTFPPPSTISDVTFAGTVVANTATIGTVWLVPGFTSLEEVNSGTVDVGPGSAFSAENIGVVAGAVNAVGGTVSSDGVLNLGTVIFAPGQPSPPVAAGSLDVSDGSTVRLGDLTVTDGAVNIDATSVLEIGTAGTASAGTITVDPGAQLFAGSLSTTAATASIAGPVLTNGAVVFLSPSSLGDVTNNGTLEFDGTMLTDSINNGALTADGGTLTAIGGTGQIIVPGSLTIGPGVTGTVDLQASTTLDIALGSGSTIGLLDTPRIDGFAHGDAIVLQGVTADSLDYSSATSTLTLSNAGNSVASIALIGTYATAQFAVSASSGASTITLNAPCFVAGTRLRTRHGDVPVEQLDIGDELVTMLGAGSRKICWIGHRTLCIAKHPRPHDVLPVRISAHTFGPGVPRCDLYLSPDHAIFADGVLIPVKYLVNGASITPVWRPMVSYWHVELDDHNVILAEDMPTESYLDTGDRGLFANGGRAVTLHPSFASLAWEAGGCAPLHVTGPVVARVRRRLAHQLATLAG